MKPKNRVMCPDCGRPKILFESESKAKNFIKFNGSEINEDPDSLRVYYCPSCCGYHVSSHSHKKEYDSRTENLIKNYKKDTAYDKVTVTIQASKLYDEMKKLNLLNRRQVNKYLSGLDYLEAIKNEARCKYYKEKKI